MCDPTVVLRALEECSRRLNAPPTAEIFDQIGPSRGVWTKERAGDDPKVVLVTAEKVAHGLLNPSETYYVAVTALIEDAVERTKPLVSFYGELDEAIRRRDKLPSIKEEREEHARAVAVS